MTIPMDNNPDNSSRERVQKLFNKNVELENRRRKAAQARIPSDPNAWQQMRENYEAIVLEDHAFSEQHEIEYALWQLHYRRIEELRAHFNAAAASVSAGSNTSQNGKGPTRGGPDRLTKIRTQFKTFLSEATGFYHDLMLKIRAKYGLPLGYFSDDSENQIPLCKDGNKSAEVKKGLISCHRCLIYLGDLARYKGLYGEGDSKSRDFAAASSYYMQAASLWPSSGNPHHQLAILASYSGDELVAIYRYFRSLAVDSPFTTARDNLIIAFEKNRQSFAQLLGDARASSVKTTSVRGNGKGRGRGESRVASKDNKVEASSVKEKTSTTLETFRAFGIRFVRLNGILFTRTSLETFGDVFAVVRGDLLELLSSGTDEEYNFGSDATDCRLAIGRMVAILIFTIHNVNRETENQSYAEILQRSVLLQNAFTATFEFMGHILERCSQLNDPSSSYLLPGIMVFVEWLACHQDIAVGSELEEKQASARLFFWNNCISFFNRLISSGFMFVDEDEEETCFSNMSRYDESETANRLALSEDFELRGFVPLLPAQLILDFSRKHSFRSDSNKEKKARVQRIIAAGKALANVVRIGEEGIYFDTKSKRFVVGVEPQVSDDFSLTTTLEAPKLSGVVEDNLVSGQMTPRALEQKPQLYMEGEEEDDEVIVFKPSMTEKHLDGIALNPTSSEVFGSTMNAASIGGDVGSFSTGREGYIAQNAFSASLRPPTSLVNSSYLQPVQPSTTWMAEQGTLVNGLGNLNLFENGFIKKPESQKHFGALPAQTFPVSLPDSSFGTGSNFPNQLPETVVPSKLDSIMSLGADNISMKPSSVSPAGLKKNPVGRPLRHLGPPPGFGSVPSKTVDESLSAMSFKNENATIPQMDDYSWLDGYQLPLVNRSVAGLNSSNHPGQGYPIGSKSSSSMGMPSFPFPGKQTTTLQQQQQLQKANQQSAVLQQQYQGQSLWEGRFFV
ncbi:unnamed protein product [Coffea canephora]|uniref:DNA/RNA-binding domain-containing protein n=1 Tax=Coffea canephora TaxID=49390 RepID=A0A068ULX4_COFCA|nr:unnamed protein product [Coffea canephora]